MAPITRIHHATVARATRLGYTIALAEGRVTLTRNSDMLPATETFDTPAEAMEGLDRGEVQFAAPKPAKQANGMKSGFMHKIYHDRYSRNQAGPGCNDQLDIHLRDAIYITPANGGKPVVDTNRLVEIATDNGVWNPAWDGLNNGQLRMNIANRLRAQLRNDAGLEVVIEGMRGRFGVEYKPAAIKARRMARLSKSEDKV